MSGFKKKGSRHSTRFLTDRGIHDTQIIARVNREELLFLTKMKIL
jgi:hypothetical protein